MSTNTIDTRVVKLQNVSKEHLYYEIWMLYEVTFRLAPRIQDTVVRNAMIESFVIHAAIVLDFLFNKKIKPDDVIADDFMNDKDAWERIYSSHVEKFSFITQRRNKELAHLSYERLKVTPQEKQWHYVAITREISDLIDLFIDSANKELLHDKVVKLKGVYRNNPMWQSIPDFQTFPIRNIT